MNWPETLELTLDGIAQGGDAVGRWEGRVVFAAGGIPGERVRVRLREARAAFARGEVTEVLEASPHRVPPRVPGADHMPWQHIAYEAQLRFRRTILAEQLAKIGGLAGAPVEETVPASPPWAYRSGARLHCDGTQVGYHAADTRAIREIDSDPLLRPVLDAAIPPLRQALWETGGAHGPLEVALRASETYGYVVAALTGPGARFTRAAARLAGRWRSLYPPLAGVTVGEDHGGPRTEGRRSVGGGGWTASEFDEHDPPTVGRSSVHGPQSSVILGQATLVEELDAVSFELRPDTFFQVNLAAAEALLRLVRAGLALRGGERLLDVYCGAGTFALPLARAVAEVVGVEEHSGAVADGRASAETSGIGNVRFVVGRAEEALARLDGPFDAVVLDPPRRGCHPRALEALLALAPARLVYVSCHPATLARDLKVLVEGGYRLLRSTPVDLFPQTAHVESVNVLEHQ
ncbi:MAG TPA: 23S rRNA (uracil(1939)-C(5))-methyltransferase RlmD [Roseiflexaceae bacterium]|nr:23S rRNA (uracil(1939)-C(5))-methyltransferase RlmD [Roseiflexaceae bacterium]